MSPQNQKKRKRDKIPQKKRRLLNRSSSSSFINKGDGGDQSWSKLSWGTSNGSHQFKIDGFSLVKGIGPGNHIDSETFRAGGYEWVIYFYPDGVKVYEYGRRYISAYVKLLTPGVEWTRFMFQLALLDQTSKGRHHVVSHFKKPIPDFGPFFLKTGSMWGVGKLYRRDLLASCPYYTMNNSLVIHCTVGALRKCVKSYRNFVIPLPPSDMSGCFKELLESGLGSDVTLQVGQKTFKAHKHVLAARSPVFKQQFFGPNGNPKLEKIVVEDMEPTIFEEILSFLYSDKLSSCHELSGSIQLAVSTVLLGEMLRAASRFELERLRILSEAKLTDRVGALCDGSLSDALTIDTISMTLDIADRYGLERLRALYERKLCAQLTNDTVATTLALAEKHHCTQLNAACLKFTAAQRKLEALRPRRECYMTRSRAKQIP